MDQADEIIHMDEVTIAVEGEDTEGENSQCCSCFIPCCSSLKGCRQNRSGCCIKSGDEW